MASVNKAILVGNLGRDPETRYTQGGMAVASFSLATTRKRKDQSGEYREETQWHRITCWDRLAEIAGEYLRKGSQVYIEGEIRYGKYTDKDGVERNTTDIHATALQMMGGRRDDDGAGQGDAPQQRQAQRPAATQQRQQAPARQASNNNRFMDDDSDVPF